MRKIDQIASLGENKIVALTTTGELWIYQERRGKPKWGPMTAIPQDKLDVVTMREKLQPVYWVLAKKDIMGCSYFTGANWSQNPERAEKYSPQKAQERAEATGGTFAMSLADAMSTWKTIIGPRKRKRKK